MPICKQCHTEKEITEFYVSNKGTCKECIKLNVRENRKQKAEYYREYEKSRAMLPHRVEARRKYAKENPEVVKRCQRKYAKSDKAKAAQARYAFRNKEKIKKQGKEFRKRHSDRLYEKVKKSRREHPEKWYARGVVAYALKRGDIKKGPCVVCGVTKTQAHHPDYSKPLDVIWMCSLHHNRFHAGLIEL